MTFSLFKGYFNFRFSTKSPDGRLIQKSGALLNRKSLKKKRGIFVVSLNDSGQLENKV